MCILRAGATEAPWAGGYVSPPRMRLMPKPCGACEARDSSYVRGRRQVGERKRLRPSQTGSPHRPSIAGTRVIPPGRWAVGRVRPGRRAPLWRPNTVDGPVGASSSACVTRHSAPIRRWLSRSWPPAAPASADACWRIIGELGEDRSGTDRTTAGVGALGPAHGELYPFDRCTRARGLKHG